MPILGTAKQPKSKAGSKHYKVLFRFTAAVAAAGAVAIDVDAAIAAVMAVVDVVNDCDVSAKKDEDDGDENGQQGMCPRMKQQKCWLIVDGDNRTADSIN